MELYDLSILKIDSNQLDDNGSPLYDLIEPTFSLTHLVTTYPRIVTKEQEMRIDLISDAIYGTPEYADLLLDLNDIDNPLNIKEGDTIQYVLRGQIESLRIDTNITANNRKLLLNPNKSQKDPRRQQYLDNNYQLSPTLLQDPGNPVTTHDGKITVTPLS